MLTWCWADVKHFLFEAVVRVIRQAIMRVYQKPNVHVTFTRLHIS